MKRYEIREQEPTETQRLLGVTTNVFVVWDMEKDMRVAFGNYRDHAGAQARVERLEAR